MLLIIIMIQHHCHSVMMGITLNVLINVLYILFDIKVLIWIMSFLKEWENKSCFWESLTLSTANKRPPVNCALEPIGRLDFIYSNYVRSSSSSSCGSEDDWQCALVFLFVDGLFYFSWREVAGFIKRHVHGLDNE